MKIISLKIKNAFYGWEFEDIKFTSNLTLLVGVSGVGKTQILNSIKFLQDIAEGHPANGFEWDITFSTVSKKEFRWKGAFSTIDENELNKTQPIILFETLINQQKK